MFLNWMTGCKNRRCAQPVGRRGDDARHTRRRIHLQRNNQLVIIWKWFSEWVDFCVETFFRLERFLLLWSRGKIVWLGIDKISDWQIACNYCKYLGRACLFIVTMARKIEQSWWIFNMIPSNVCKIRRH